MIDGFVFFFLVFLVLFHNWAEKLKVRLFVPAHLHHRRLQHML